MALLHLLGALGDAGEPLDHREQVHGFPGRDRALAQRGHDGSRRRDHVVGRADCRDLERERPVGPGRQHPLHAQAHGGRTAALGAVEDGGDGGLRPLGEQLLHGEGLLVAGAGRPAGGIAAVSWREAHDDNSFGN
jgi:hypothetical protein